MTDVVIREPRPGDAEASAELWREVGGLFAEMNPHLFHVPAAEGLAEWYEEIHAHYRAAPDKVLLLAEVDGELAGSVSAAIEEAIEGAQRELQIDLGRRRMHVNFLAVAGAHRRDGVGTALMRAVEDWGRSQGAEVIVLETETNNPLSVPFYEKRMGFTAQAYVYRNEIAPRAE